MKKIFNKEGYTLTYAIVVIGVLLILTASVTFVAYFNLKTSRIGGNVNTSFYANDGAMEEALTELNIFSYNAEVAGWNRVTSDLLLETNWTEFLNAIYKDINESRLSIEKGNDLIERALRGEFETTYFNVLFGGSVGSPVVKHDFFDSSEDELNTSSRYLDYSTYSGVDWVNPSGTHNLSSALTTKITTTLFNPTNIIAADNQLVITIPTLNLQSDQVNLSIRSDGTYHSYDKAISVDVELRAPEYSFSVAMLQESVVLQRNDITNNALVSNRNIVVAQGTTNVTGDIYAYGDFKESSDNVNSQIDVLYNQNRDQYGGIVLGYRDSGNRVYDSTFADAAISGNSTGSLDVMGSIATRNSVKMEVSGSDLDVSDDLFANAFYIRHGANNTTTNIDNNMFLYSDLFVSGDSNRITVGTTLSSVESHASTTRDLYRPGTGEIWGLHDLNADAGNNYTRLGSIIISTNASDPIVTANGLFLYGVIRYDVTGKEDRNQTSADVSYKTGESFTTFNNSQYYQTLVSDNIYQTGVFSFLSQFSDGSNLYDLISFDALYASLDQVKYRGNHYFTMGYLAALDTTDLNYKDISDEDKKILRFRNADDNASNEFYGIAAPGVLSFSDSDGNNGKVYHNDRTPSATLDIGLRQDVLTGFNLSNSYSITNHVDKRINLLGYSDNVAGHYVEVDLFDNWMQFTEPSVPIVSESSTLAMLYNKDISKDVYINYPTQYAGHINLQGSGSTNSIMEGTIVTLGNVYIYSDGAETFEYTGNIIAGGSIYLMGAGEKNFIHDETVIYQTINKSQVLKNLYYTDLGRKLHIPSNPASAKNAAIDSTMSSFEILFSDNSGIDAEIRFNYVSGAETGGTNIIDSNSLTITNWKEVD